MMQETKHIFYIGGIMSDSIIEECINHSISYDMAANNFQRKFIEGLPKDTTYINAPFIQYNKKRKKNIVEVYQCLKITKSQSYFNYKYINNITKYFALKKSIKNLNFNNSIIFCYSIHTPFLKLIKKIKKNFDVQVIQIVPDLPQFMNLNKKVSYIYKILKKIDMYRINKLLNYIDLFIPFTLPMYNDFLIRYKKPYYIMEGISEINTSYDKDKKAEKSKKSVVYAGTLNRKYGVEKLIKVFSFIKDKDIELIICGSGELSKEISNTSATNIKYLGLLNSKQAKELIKNADLLINPREELEAYTRYSFPSKLFEYLSSGNKVICFKLSGIPEDYDQFLYYFKSNDEYTMAKNIIEALYDPINKNNSKNFLKNKTAQKHIENIFEKLGSVQF